MAGENTVKERKNEKTGFCLLITLVLFDQSPDHSPCSPPPRLLCLKPSSARRALHFRRCFASSHRPLAVLSTTAATPPPAVVVNRTEADIDRSIRYPNRKKYKGPKFWRYYDEFLEIFGDSHATGNNSHATGNTADTCNSMLLEDIIEPFPTTPASQSTPFQMKPENTQSFTQMLHEDSPPIQSPTSATPTPQHPTMTTNRTTNSLVEMDDIDMFYDDEELECYLIRIAAKHPARGAAAWLSNFYGMLAGNVSPMTGETIKPACGSEEEAFRKTVVTPIFAQSNSRLLRLRASSPTERRQPPPDRRQLPPSDRLLGVICCSSARPLVVCRSSARPLLPALLCCSSPVVASSSAAIASSSSPYRPLLCCSPPTIACALYRLSSLPLIA
ncbi:Callose synthase 3 [Nymphaea thermarum]|nr:Callose synthase 3 [Nymphaea thermarum]